MYNNPYMVGAGMRSVGGLGKAGLFSSIRTINWANLLGNTQKTLGIINQAIPIVYQVKPIVNNARTMFKVMGAVQDNQTTYENTNTKQNGVAEEMTNSKPVDNQPIFFI